MRTSTTSALAAVILLGLTGAAMAQQQGNRMQGMDHSGMQGMDHSKMQGMDHSGMAMQGGQGAAPGAAQDGQARPAAKRHSAQQRHTHQP